MRQKECQAEVLKSRDVSPIRRVLIIDDDEVMSRAMSSLIQRMGHGVEYAMTLDNGLAKALAGPWDVVFLDVMMPDGNGLHCLPQIKEAPCCPEVIIITASGSAEGAELAIKSGAWDYIDKSSSIKEMMLSLDRALQYRREKQTCQPAPVALKRERIIGNSPKMKACLDLLAYAAASDANVLIGGETGTGKELFARAIHYNKPRSREKILSRMTNGNGLRTEKAFVVVDCTSLPETLVESVLFGHEKGAFTGAEKPQSGLVQQADGGTLFLDEIAELPLSTQKRFLRVLQERSFRPVGGKAEIKSNFRLVAATNQDLDKMAAEGMFREDLLFRLRSLVIDLPPLRERKEDIKDLTRFHVARLCDRYDMPTKGFSSDFFDTLSSYHWPGNVRELVNTLDGALAVSGTSPTLFSQHLPLNIRVQKVQTAVVGGNRTDAYTNDGSGETTGMPKFRQFRQVAEKQYLKDLLAVTNRNIKNACRLSGLSRSRLYELLQKHELSSSRKAVA